MEHEIKNPHFLFAKEKLNKLSTKIIEDQLDLAIEYEEMILSSEPKLLKQAMNEIENLRSQLIN